MMKLQIVEYNALDILEGTTIYRYVLLIEGRVGACISSTIKKDTTEVYEKLSQKIIDDYEDYTLEIFPKFNIPPNLKGNVLSEIEISDTFFKEIKIKKRLNDMQKDFV